MSGNLLRPLLFFLAFLALEGGAFLTIQSFEREQIQQYHFQRTGELQTRYEAVGSAYALVATTIYNEVVNRREVMDLFKRAWQADEAGRKEIRDRLHDSLAVTYDNLKAMGLRQLHFHLPDGTSFLRMHRPGKFGDKLFGIRYSLFVANTERMVVSGFEEGRIFNGFRYVFPLFDENGEHVGSVETSLGFQAISREMRKIFPAHYHFLLRKEVVVGKVFKDERKNYIPSDLSDEYLYENKPYADLSIHGGPSLEGNIPHETIAEINRKIRARALPLLEKESPFSLCGTTAEGQYLVSFLPIRNVKGERVAFIVSYVADDTVAGIQRRHWTVFAIVGVLILLVTLFAYGFDRSKRRLVENTRRIRSITENMGEGLFLLDTKGVVEMANPAAAGLLGYSREEVEGRTMEELVRGGEKCTIIKKLEEEDLFISHEIRFFHKDGHPVPVSVAATPFFEEGRRTGAVVVYQDITEQVELEKELRRALETEKKFLASMSHEMRTPLNSVIGFIDLLSAEGLEGKRQEYADHAAISARHLLELINDVLDVSKVEAGQLELTTRPFDLHRILTECGVITSTRIQGRVDLVVDVPRLERMVIGDALRIKQVFVNLLSNAVKFTEKGEIRLFMKEMERTGEGYRFTVCVKDTGVGIPKEKQSGLFHAFKQAHGSEKGGTGLGLYLSQAIVTLMGGTITMESEPGKGTSFCVSFALTVGEPLDPEEEREVETAGDYGDLKVLVVEDVKMNVTLAREMFRRFFNLEFDHAADGLQGVEAVRNGAYDLVFMDIQMPELDGLSAARRIREFDGETPIVAMTANALAEDVEEAYSAGMDGYITKPIRRNEVGRVLRQAKKGKLREKK